MTGTLEFSVPSSESFPVAVSPLSHCVEVLSGTLRSFARSVLTPLREREGKDDLAETTRVWLDSHCSVADAATVLHVHPNTVKYRLKNIGKLLGRDLKASDQLLEVRLAVDIERLTQARGLSPETHSSRES